MPMPLLFCIRFPSKRDHDVCPDIVTQPASLPRHCRGRSFKKKSIRQKDSQTDVIANCVF